jgi:hypothetical protein
MNTYEDGRGNTLSIVSNKIISNRRERMNGSVAKLMKNVKTKTAFAGLRIAWKLLSVTLIEIFIKLGFE